MTPLPYRNGPNPARMSWNQELELLREAKQGAENALTALEKLHMPAAKYHLQAALGDIKYNIAGLEKKMEGDD